MADNNNKRIIDDSMPGIVIKETPLSLSDEKMKRILLQTYEAATKDANAFKYYKLYSVLLSISFTLLIPLLTSTFRSIGSLSAECVTKVAWFACILCGVFGIIFLLIASRKKMNHDIESRDKAINSIFDSHFKSD